MKRTERGSVVLLVAFIGLVLAGAAMLLVRIGIEVDQKAKAQTAADAAALAAAGGGAGAAQALASANDAQLIDLRFDDGDAVAEVKLGRHLAWARARPHGT